MKNIVFIIGARPNFMKAFPVYEALKKDFNLTLIHTGQHFDEKMSKVFFEQLKFPHPDIHLTLDKRTKAGDFDDKLYINNEEYLKNKDQVIKDLIEYQGELGQMGEIRDKLKKEFEHLKPDLVIVFGDVTSTLAAGLASKMLNIDIAHVESGLRSGDIKMPEEVNRILTDHITKYYFITEQSGVDNLNSSGITENVYLVGNTMIDTQKKYLQQALDTKYHEKLGVKSKEYILITLHRPSNVDDMDKLREIFDELQELSKTEKLVYPIHPRTKNNLEKLGYLQKVQENPNIILQDPLGYLEFTCLMANCKYVVTDSGGLQEETTALDIPCFTLRENTERPSTLIENHGTNQMISKISEIELKECKSSMKLWDGKSSEKILIISLLEYYGENVKSFFTNHPPFKPAGCTKDGALLQPSTKYDYLYHLNKIMNLDCISYNFFKTWVNLFHINSFHIFQFLNNLLHKFDNIFLYNLKPYYWKFKTINNTFFSNDKLLIKSKEYFNFSRIDTHNIKQISNNIIITSADKIYFEKYFFKYYENLLNKKETIFICCDENDYAIIKNKLNKFNNIGYILFNNYNMPNREYYQSLRIFGLYFLRKNIKFEKSFIFNIDTIFNCKSIFSDVINCTKNSDTKLILVGGQKTAPLYQKCSMNKVLIYNTNFIDLFYKMYLYQYYNLKDKRFLDQISLFIASNYSTVIKEYVNIDKLIIGCAKYRTNYKV
tara:strand:- start:6752 stop:8902 length:2151 start_codon:yes stop_codon:yes gene_type:complete